MVRVLGNLESLLFHVDGIQELGDLVVVPLIDALKNLDYSLVVLGDDSSLEFTDRVNDLKARANQEAIEACACIYLMMVNVLLTR